MVMEDFVPKRVFTFLDINPNEKIYEICLTLRGVHGEVAETARVFSNGHFNLRNSILFDAVELKCLVAGDGICEFEVKPRI
jgi:predicted hydrocarbon binding protein